MFWACIFEKTIKSFKMKVDVQKGPLKFRGKLTIHVLDSIQFTLVHPNDVCFRSCDYEFYPMDENGPMTSSLDNESGLYM